MSLAQSITSSTEQQAAARGAVLLRRAAFLPWVHYLESGRVILGVMDGDTMEHQLGVVEGPCWWPAGVLAGVVWKVPCTAG